MQIEYIIKTPRLSLMEQFLIEVFEFERFERDEEGSLLFYGPFFIRLLFQENICEDKESHIKVCFESDEIINELKTKLDFFYYRLGYENNTVSTKNIVYDPDGRKWEISKYLPINQINKNEVSEIISETNY